MILFVIMDNLSDSLNVVLQHSDETFSPLLTDALGWSLFAFIVITCILIIVFTFKVIFDE